MKNPNNQCGEGGRDAQHQHSEAENRAVKLPKLKSYCSRRMVKSCKAVEAVKLSKLQDYKSYRVARAVKPPKLQTCWSCKVAGAEKLP